LSPIGKIYSHKKCATIFKSYNNEFFLTNIIYVWRKVVCFVLFCNYEIHWTGMLLIMFLVSLESSRWGGVHGFGSMMFGLAVQKFLNIEWFLYWELNRSWNFQRNSNMPLVLLKRSWWIGFNGIDLVIFGFRMWEIFIFTWFMPLKIQINPKKEKISWGHGNTWVNGIDHTSEQLN
jgi:hypothetical protein